MFRFDHVAVSCEVLEDGAAAVAEALGVAPGGGGQHPDFGTHNRLLSLGPAEYLEVIAIDPDAPAPGRARWFGLDHFAGPPRLSNWVLACEDLDAAVARLGPLVGQPMQLSRGAYRWRMAVPETGVLPFDNIHPALIEWQGPRPAPTLPVSGCALAELVVSHPEAGRLAATLGLDDPRIRFAAGKPGLQARIDTPTGPASL
ncbi:VOC family protein [Tropicimonas sp. IMCC34043]|uniref:VOC family protein n=1 Tax=Tropicimonas sp. IMCC34043 TaxID=2248760 RepID=UPI000E2807C6|nr:VOC family protein [Tropicimonas sp. IMCC34043]